MVRKTDTAKLDQTRALMAALGRMPPKQHKEMKVGKDAGRITKGRQKRVASSTSKTA